MAQYGDQIKLQMESERTDRIRAPTPRQEQAVDRLGRIDGLDPVARQVVEEAVHAAQLAEESAKAGAMSEGARLAARRRAIADLHRGRSKLVRLTIPDEHLRELGYVLEMERALILFTIGKELGPVAGNPSLVDANRIYSEMVAAYPERPVATYRLARTQDELNDRAAAQSSYERTLDLLKASELPPEHWVRSAAPRLLGFSKWEEGVAILRKGGDSAEGEAVRLFDDAIRYTEAAISEFSTADDAGRARNNLLYYSVDRLRIASVTGGIDAAHAAKLRALVNQVVTNANDDFRLWDTIRVASEFLDDRPAARAAAERIIQIVTDPNRTSRIPNETTILEDARKALEPVPHHDEVGRVKA